MLPRLAFRSTCTEKCSEHIIMYVAYTIIDTERKIVMFIFQQTKFQWEFYKRKIITSRFKFLTHRVTKTTCE